MSQSLRYQTMRMQAELAERLEIESESEEATKLVASPESMVSLELVELVEPVVHEPFSHVDSRWTADY